MEQPPIIPPPSPAPYYRPGVPVYGSPEKLQALADGYFGLTKVFIVNVVLAIGVNGLVRSEAFHGITLLILALGSIVFTLVLIGLLTYPCNKKIAFGKDWSPGAAVTASILMAINSALCCGIIGYAVMQQIAYNEMRKKGLKRGFFGVSKKNVQAAIAQMREHRPQ